MELKEAIDRAESDEGVKKLTKYFMCSCFVCIKDIKDKIDEWTLLFYNPEKELVIDCFVNDKFVTLGEETPPLKEVKKPDFTEAHVTIKEALETVEKKFDKKTINVLITLHQKDTLVWTINMITPDMNATTFDIDAKTGNIVHEETTSLIRRL
ncbi:MAG: PepSY domain-containing protein [Candidatus Aenigmatarchaeota archaeon]